MSASAWLGFRTSSFAVLCRADTFDAVPIYLCGVSELIPDGGSGVGLCTPPGKKYCLFEIVFLAGIN